MDTQKQKEFKCDTCGKTLQPDKTGKLCCIYCNNNTPPKNLYEESFFDLKDYNI